MTNYAFYDFETSGISPKFDQALQFAAILTDENFQPIEEVNERCRLADHILPSPIAMAITGVTPHELLNQDRNYFEFSQYLAELIKRWSPAIWTGYNSISFDENVFRQMFYQNLHPNLYLTQQNQNTRLDILKTVYACWGFGSEALQIPIQANGKLTSKLDTLAPANGFQDHAAHDALGDVKATIYVAQRIRDHAPEIWSVIEGNLDKNQLRSQLEAGAVFHLVERFGAAPPKIHTGVYCGTSDTNGNQFGFFDLDQADPSDYVNGDAGLFAAAVEKSPKIIRTVDLNKVPMLFPAMKPTPEQLGHAKMITETEAIHRATAAALAGRYADREAPDLVEAQIYEDFYSPADKERLRRFHTSDWQERAAIVSELDDARLQELGARLLVLFGSDHTTDTQKEAFRQLIADRWSGAVHYGESERNPGNTYDSVQDDLAELEAGTKFEIPPPDLQAMKEFFKKRKL